MPTSVAPVDASMPRPTHLDPNRPEVRRVTMVAPLWPRPAAFDPLRTFPSRFCFQIADLEVNEPFAPIPTLLPHRGE